MAMPDAEKETLAPQRELGSAWSKLVPSFPDENVHVLPSVEHALRIVHGLEEAHTDKDVQVLVTGSLHLVGGVIEVAGLAEVALGTY
jgi:folylpolyglutamate synthase